jgi:hypothetical protein
MKELPLTPEKVLAALKEKNDGPKLEPSPA